MPDWRCDGCGAVNLDGQRSCEACGHDSPAHGKSSRAGRGRPTEAYQEPEWAKHPPPCTPEQNERAHHLVWAVIDGTVSVGQARQVLSEMFQGREVEL